jgi:thiol-disulfide isomerase/thioredoxin
MNYKAAIGFLIFFVCSHLTGQSIVQIDSGELAALTGHENDTTYVINFWATWCSPCVKEIGYFEEVHRLYQSEKLEVVMVSLDFPDNAEQRVIPFLQEKGITTRVLLMTDLNYNDWIDRVDPSWSGAIPATLIYKNDQRIFLEKEISREELFNHVKQIMN